MNGRPKKSISVLGLIPNLISGIYNYFFHKPNEEKGTYAFHRFNDLLPVLQNKICQFSPHSMVGINKHWHQFLSMELKSYEYKAQLIAQLNLATYQLQIIHCRFNTLYSHVKEVESEFLELQLIDHQENNLAEEIEKKLDSRLQVEISKNEVLHEIESVPGTKECSIKLQALRIDLTSWREAHCHEARLLSKATFLNQLVKQQKFCNKKNLSEQVYSQPSIKKLN